MLGPVSFPSAKAVPDAQVSSEAGLADMPPTTFGFTRNLGARI